MTRISKLLLLSALLIIVAVPLVATAQTVGPTQADQGGGTFGGLFPIVPCGTSKTQPCTPCGLLDVLENIVKFVTVGVTGPVAALLFIYAGVLFLTSAGNTNRVQQARRVLTNTVYGVTIILLSWLVVVQLIKIVAPGSAADRWYEFSCPALFEGAGAIPILPPPRDVPPDQSAAAQLKGIECTNYTDIAQIFGTNPSVTAESPLLVAAIACITSDPVVQALEDPSKRFTFEQTNPWCNVSRGRKVVGCTGTCAHGRGSGFSCHYGGKTGVNGAEGVDFNATSDDTVAVFHRETRQVISIEQHNALKGAKDETLRKQADEYQIVSGEKGLYDAILFVSKNDCKNIRIKRIDLERTSATAFHTHLSVGSCDVDGPKNNNYNLMTEAPLN